MSAPVHLQLGGDGDEDGAAIVVASDAGGLVPLGLVESARGYAADARAPPRLRVGRHAGRRAA